MEVAKLRSETIVGAIAGSIEFFCDRYRILIGVIHFLISMLSFHFRF